MLDTPFWITDLCDADMSAKCEIMQKARGEAQVGDCVEAYGEYAKGEIPDVYS